MNSSVFLMLLLIVSTFTGLVVEAIKKCLQERGKKYHANAMAGYVAVALSVAVSAAYVILTGAAINMQMAVYLIALIFLSWLASMLGYDKVVQAISQFKYNNKEDEQDD